jgi:hypothetical protein
MKVLGRNEGVAEVLSSVLLLAIAVSVFSVIYIQVLSDDGPAPEIVVTLMGKVEPEGDIHNTVTFENQRGESLSTDTEIILEIYGDKQTIKISDLALIYPFLKDGWDIGEKLYPVLELKELTDVRIDATIVEKDSNSIIFWGILQQGSIAPFYGKGGIWHFDEDNWDGTPGEVKDSSGNGNNGTAYGKANTIGDAKSIKAGSFNGWKDYVYIKNHYSLNMHDEITVEAWMKPLTFNPILETQEYSNLSHGYEPDIIQVANDVYAIACRGKQPHAGMLDTVTINEEGEISDTVIDELKFDEKEGFWPNIIKITGDIYAIAYGTGDNPQNSQGFIKTISISPEGKIGEVVNDTLKISDNCHKPNIVHVFDDIYAISYTGLNNDGFISTVEITVEGQIIPTGYLLEFDTFNGDETNSVFISSNVIATVYRGPNNDGFLKTFFISSDGQITPTPHELEFDTDNCHEPDIISISGNIYAIAYRGSDDDGFLKTFIITPDGQIIPTLHELEFDTYDCNEPDIIHSEQDFFAIIYNQGTGSGNRKGVLIELEILTDGSIIYSGEPLTESIGEKCFSPKIIYVSDQIFGVVYYDKSSHPLRITSIRKKDQTPPWYRGIFKSASVNIYADENSVYGSLTTADNIEHHLVIEGITPENWYYIALTFDGINICLYCNKDNPETDTFKIVPDQTYKDIELPYKQKIKASTSDLLFGYKFLGYLDEVAINERALTALEIQNHFDNPGFFENEP